MKSRHISKNTAQCGEEELAMISSVEMSLNGKQYYHPQANPHYQ